MLYFFKFNLNYYYIIFKIVYLKKNSSTFKKLNNFLHPSLFKNNVNNDIFLNFKSFFNNNFFKLFVSFNINYYASNRTFDLKKRFFKNLIETKSIFNYFLINKKTKFFKFKFYLNLFFFFKKKNNILNFFNYNLNSILIFSKFIFNFSDFIFFKENDYIYLDRLNTNSKLNNFTMLKSNDLIELNFNKFYFNYLLKNYFFFKKNSQNSKNFNYSNFNFLFKSKYLNSFNSLKFAYFNKLFFFEIDFRTLTIFFIYSNFSKSQLLYSGILKNKILNFYLDDYYRWKKRT